jgi:hypothetical protein
LTTALATPFAQGVFGSSVGTGVGTGIGSELGGIAGGLAGGKNIKEAAVSAAPGAISKGLVSGITDILTGGAPTQSDKLLGGLASTGLAYGLSSLKPFQTSSSATGPSAAITAGGGPLPASALITQPTSGRMGTTVMSPGYGAGPGVPIFGSEKSATPTGVWGQGTLRATDTEQA